VKTHECDIPGCRIWLAIGVPCEHACARKIVHLKKDGVVHKMWRQDTVLLCYRDSGIYVVSAKTAVSSYLDSCHPHHPHFHHVQSPIHPPLPQTYTHSPPRPRFHYNSLPTVRGQVSKTGKHECVVSFSVSTFPPFASLPAYGNAYIHFSLTRLIYSHSKNTPFTAGRSHP
jgi:hypothetical protein